MAGINEGVEYLKSIPSVLKILEIVFLVIGIGSVGYFLDNGGDDDYKKKDNLKFFVGAAAAVGFIALLFFLIFLTGLHKKIDAFNWAKTAAVIFLILAILLLVASALLADSVRYYKDDVPVCEGLDILNADSQCAQLTAGAVFGFFAVVVFVVDSIVHFKL